MHIYLSMYIHVHNISGFEVYAGGQSYSYDYGWAAFNKSSVRRPLQKMPLTLYEATFQHIRLHKLTHNDSLKFFMSMMASVPVTLAIVLINFEDTYRLAEKFVSEEGEGKMPSVPVILVTNETGSKLLQLLEEYPRDVEAVIHRRTPEASPSLLPHNKEMILPSPAAGIYMYMYMYIHCLSARAHACVGML